jgi:hypothetical protein
MRTADATMASSSGETTSIAPHQATRWEAMNPTSFGHTVYLHCLKVSITVGSFVMYTVTGDSTPQIGRVIDVVSARDSVPQKDDTRYLLEGGPSPGCSSSSDEKMPVQFVKVNLFKYISSFEGGSAIAEENNDNTTSSCNNGWQIVVQADEYCWILSLAICNLSFVFIEEDVSSGLFDDCRGMYNFFVVKHRVAQDGCVSAVPRDACPPFPGCIEGFHKNWCIDHCKLIFNNIRQIRMDMQRILCRVAQSQGDFSTCTVKVQLPSCSWFFIKNAMARHGIESTSGVRNSQPRTILSWGLCYQSLRHTAHLDVLRFDTEAKMVAFRELFGHTCGFGVRKKRPKYSDGRELLCINDVVNVVSCTSNLNERQRPQKTGEDVGNSTSDANWRSFRNGVMQDGIDLAYDVDDGVLQVVIRYHKVVVTMDEGTVTCLKRVGVGFAFLDERDTATLLGNRTTAGLKVSNILPGMEFLDHSFVMRVVSVAVSEVRARKVYKVLRDLTTVRAIDTGVVIYTDMEYVLNQIQEMLE